MTMMLITAGVASVSDLLDVLPLSVRDTIDHDTLLEADFASALRLLATIRNDGWHQFVRTYTVDWAGLLAWVRQEFLTTESVRVRVEIAASLAGHENSQALLLYGARALDGDNFEALIDALRIARQGVSK